MTNLKRKQIRIYLDDEDEDRLANLSAKIGKTMTETTIVTTLLSAALKACDDAGGRMPLPLLFQFSEPFSEGRSVTPKTRK